MSPTSSVPTDAHDQYAGNRADRRGEGRLWFVGALPPPLNGQSNCNRAMLGDLRRRGAAIRLYDIGGTMRSKLVGIVRAMLAILIGAKSGDKAYLSVPGQAGVWLFVPLAFVLRLRGLAHFVHHHSFRPINLGPLRGMRMLVRAGGRHQRHILLSADMRRRFAALYLTQAEDRALALSNAYLFKPPALAIPPRPDRPVTLGHMSVLTYEKGVGYLLDLFAASRACGRDWRLVIAGPCADPELDRALRKAVTANPDRVDYRGAVGGEEKERFFADIDLFVLPTTLIDEAEPLVMIEAFGRGVDVVANDTGCIRNRIRTPDHLLTRDRDADAVRIAARIAEAAQDWDATRQACAAHARAITLLADAEAAAVLAQLQGSGGFAIDTGPVT